VHPTFFLVHPAFFENCKIAPVFFLFLKVVFFFKKKNRAVIVAHSSSRFSLFGAVFSSISWQQLGSMKVKVAVFSVAVVVISIRGMQFCCLCVQVYSWSCKSTWSIKALRINLICRRITDQVDLQQAYGSTWSAEDLRRRRRSLTTAEGRRNGAEEEEGETVGCWV